MKQTKASWKNCSLDEFGTVICNYIYKGNMHVSYDGENFYNAIRINISDHSIDFIKKEGSIWVVLHEEEKQSWFNRFFNKKDNKPKEIELSEEKVKELIKFLKE